MIRFLGFSLVLLLTSCKEKVDVYNLDAFSSSNVLQAVIEIPAGTNSKVEYNTTSKAFEIDQENGKDRVISYLPYPGNYGFIPGTLGGDGDALDILVLSPSQPTGTILEVIPIGIFKLLDEGEMDFKIIGIPREEASQTIRAHTLKELQSTYPKVKEIITEWFLNYNPSDTAKNLGWGNEKEAIAQIDKSLKKKK